MINYSVRHLPEEERPRERLQRFGPETLSTTEKSQRVLVVLSGFHRPR